MDEYELYLCHHGVKGMKWGVRKARQLVDTSRRVLKNTYNQVSRLKSRGSTNRPNGSNKRPTTTQNADPHQARVQKAKKAVKIGAAVAGTVLAVYGVKKLNDALVSFNAEQGRRAIERIQRAHDLSYQRYWLSQNR
jgi:hypothetical protein